MKCSKCNSSGPFIVKIACTTGFKVFKEVVFVCRNCGTEMPEEKKKK